MLGMPSRRQCTELMRQCLDTSSGNSDTGNNNNSSGGGGKPNEYSCSITLLGGGGAAPAIFSHFWFGDSVDEGRQYMQQHVKKCGFCVASKCEPMDYWSGIQRLANGPKGEDSGPAGYYMKGYLPHRMTAKMSAFIADQLDAKQPFKGMQPVVLLDLIGGKGKASCSTDVSSNAAAPTTDIWIIVVMQWQPQLSGSGAEDTIRAHAVQWVRHFVQQLELLEKMGDNDIAVNDPATSVTAAAATEVVAIATDAEEGAPSEESKQQHGNYREILSDYFLMNDAVAAEGQRATQLMNEKALRTTAIKKKYDPRGLFLR